MKQGRNSFGEIDPEPFCKIPPIDENEEDGLNFDDSIYSAETVSDVDSDTLYQGEYKDITWQEKK